MPEISRFFGIVIAIYYKEHGVPHFHAKYSGQTGVFSIVDLKLIEGRLPKRVVALVLEWAFEHRSELLQNWQRAVAQRPAVHCTAGIGWSHAFRQGRQICGRLQAAIDL
jgi:hypothetical protein